MQETTTNQESANNGTFNNETFTYLESANNSTFEMTPYVYDKSAKESYVQTQFKHIKIPARMIGVPKAIFKST